MLNILGGMEPNTSGDVIVAGKNIAKYNAKELTTYRRNDVGFVFQFYNLISNLTAKENVELAAQIVPDAMSADDALQYVDLEKTIFPLNYQAVSSNVWQLPEPSLKSQPYFCAMSPPVPLTIKQANES